MAGGLVGVRFISLNCYDLRTILDDTGRESGTEVEELDDVVAIH